MLTPASMSFHGTAGHLYLEKVELLVGRIKQRLDGHLGADIRLPPFWPLPRLHVFSLGLSHILFTAERLEASFLSSTNQFIDVFLVLDLSFATGHSVDEFGHVQGVGLQQVEVHGDAFIDVCEHLGEGHGVKPVLSRSRPCFPPLSPLVYKGAGLDSVVTRDGRRLRGGIRDGAVRGSAFGQWCLCVRLLTNDGQNICNLKINNSAE